MRSRTVRAVLIALVFVFLKPIIPVESAASFNLVQIGNLGGDYGEAIAVNDQAQVVGHSFTASGEQHAFFWENGVMTDLGSQGHNSIAVDINENGQVLGIFQDLGHSFIWEDGVYTDLGDIGAVDMNNRGQVVGTRNSHATLWENGIITDLGTLGGTWSYAYRINERGQVIGSSAMANRDQHAFIWENGVMTDLGTFGGWISAAWDLNELGQVVGSSNTLSGETHSFLWEDGVMTDLGTFGGPASYAYNINEKSQVIGVFFDSNDENHVYLWENGVMTQVDTTGRFQFSGPVDINDLGDIVGNTTKAYGPVESFVWQDGSMTVMVHGYLQDINNDGTAVVGNVIRAKNRETIPAVWLAK